MIWLLAAVLIAGLVALLWRPRARGDGTSVPRALINREALAESLEDIERRRAAGDLDEAAAQALVDELADRVPGETADETMPTASGETPQLKFVALALLLAALLAYAADGSWRVAERVSLAAEHPELGPKLLLDHLREYVDANPRDASAHAALGAQEFSAGRYAEAASAYAQANRISGARRADWLVGEGESLAMAAERRLDGRPMELFEQALAIDAEHPRALWFSALAAMQQGRRDEAVTLWRRMAELDTVPAHVREVLRQQIAEAGGGSSAATAEPEPVDDGPRLKLRVEHAGGAETPGGVLFVFARPRGQTAGPPLAVKRIADPRFPLQLTLGDADAMLPGNTMSAHPAWTITARLSASGSVDAGPSAPSARLDIDAEASAETHTLVLDAP